jgi:hypothetical protein
MINRIFSSMLLLTAMASPAVVMLLLQMSSTVVRADQLEDWYLNRLFAPTDAQLQQESMGKVVIYAGLRDVDVLRAMDQQFDRIEHMMFTGTIVTDNTGAALTDPNTGEVTVENDGC